MTRPPPYRVAIIASHPIQHFVPFYRALANEPGVELHVFYMSDFSVRGYFDPLMKTRISWEMDLLSGYQQSFLPEAKNIHNSKPSKLNNPSVGKALASFQPDAVIAYGYNNPTQWRALYWCWRNSVPLLMISDSELIHWRSSLRKAAKARLLPLLYRLYSAFLSTGDNNEAYLSAYGVPAEKMFRCPFTIDEDVYIGARKNRDALRRAFRARHAIDPNDFVMLTVGKLTPGKRPMDALHATKLLTEGAKSDARRIILVIAGDGALRDAAQEYIDSNNLPVRMLGFVNVDQLPAVYCGSDVLLHLSEVDAHPLALSEAACIGLPLIVSNKVGAIGTADIARPGENALVIPCGDVHAIATAARRLHEDVPLLSVMSESSIQIYSGLDMRKSVAGVVQALDYCIGGAVVSAPQQASLP